MFVTEFSNCHIKFACVDAALKKCNMHRNFELLYKLTLAHNRHKPSFHGQLHDWDSSLMLGGMQQQL